MILKHWLGYVYPRRTARTLGTMTATRLADYPIGDGLRRCVIRIATNDDATCGNDLGNARGLPCPNFAILFSWLLDDGRRFVSKPVHKSDIVDCDGFVHYGDTDAYSAASSETIYEIDYIAE